MFGQVRRQGSRAAILVAVAGSLMFAGSALAQSKGNDRKGAPPQSPPPPPRQVSAPKQDRPPAAAPRPSAPPAAAPPVATPRIQPSPPGKTPVRVVAPSAPPAVVRPQPVPTRSPQQPTIVKPASVPPSVRPPVITAPPAAAPPSAAPRNDAPKRVDQSSPRINRFEPKSPSLPQASPPKSNDRPPVLSQPPDRTGKVGGGRTDRGWGGSPKTVTPQTTPPTKTWTDTRKPVDGGFKGSPRRDDRQNPDARVPVLQTPTPRSDRDGKKVDDRRGDFSRPIRKAPETRDLGRDFRPAPPPVSPPPAQRWRNSSNLFVGVGTGVSFSSTHWFGRHNQISFSFGSSLCHYDPWLSFGWGWHHRWWRHHDWYWDCNPWGGFYYVRSWPCYPFTWWYPGYHVTAYRCGSWYRVAYEPPPCAYLTTFRFCDTPCAVVADCGLISPTVVVPAYEAPEFCWSGSNIQRFTQVDPGYVDSGTGELLPAPASAAELAGTTERELGDTYMKLGDLDSAIRVYSAHVARHPGDVLAVRALGFAMIERGDVRPGVDQVERAYRIDPTLAQRLFDRELLRTPENLGAVLDRATSLAAQSDKDSGAAAAWLAVSVLMQADRRDEPARTALDKARETGLAPRVVESMQAALPVS